jgi:adenine-specific DNA methylase
MTVMMMMMMMMMMMIGVKLDKEHWYEHVPKLAETSAGGKVTILWNQKLQTDRTIHSDKPKNVIKEETKKILKNENIPTEIQCMWNVTTKEIPVISGAAENI